MWWLVVALHQNSTVFLSSESDYALGLKAAKEIKAHKEQEAKSEKKKAKNKAKKDRKKGSGKSPFIVAPFQLLAVLARHVVRSNDNLGLSDSKHMGNGSG